MEALLTNLSNPVHLTGFVLAISIAIIVIRAKLAES